jgi:hypothetical protein
VSRSKCFCSQAVSKPVGHIPLLRFQATGRQHRGCIIPQAVTYSLVLLKMDGINARNMLSWLKLLKPLLLHLVGVYIIYMINAISLQLYFILQENHEGMERDWTISASTLSDNVSLMKMNNGTHQSLEYLMALDRWTRYEWIYQLLECLILLDCCTGNEWDISGSTGPDNVSFLNRNNGIH